MQDNLLILLIDLPNIVFPPIRRKFTHCHSIRTDVIRLPLLTEHEPHSELRGLWSLVGYAYYLSEKNKLTDDRYIWNGECLSRFEIIPVLEVCAAVLKTSVLELCIAHLNETLNCQNSAKEDKSPSSVPELQVCRPQLQSLLWSSWQWITVCYFWPALWIDLHKPAGYSSHIIFVFCNLPCQKTTCANQSLCSQRMMLDSHQKDGCFDKNHSIVPSFCLSHDCVMTVVKRLVSLRGCQPHIRRLNLSE